MDNKFIRAEEVAQELSVSKPYADACWNFTRIERQPNKTLMKGLMIWKTNLFVPKKWHRN